MKYAFVTFSIIFIWIAVILITMSTETNSILLPITALTMTIILFFIGFRSKK